MNAPPARSPFTLQPLATLHEVLMHSALDYPRTKDMVPMTDRATQTIAIERADKEKIDAICLRHGTTSSAFFRHCGKVLLQELGEDGE